jgi:hypothetical protein
MTTIGGGTNECFKPTKKEMNKEGMPFSEKPGIRPKYLLSTGACSTVGPTYYPMLPNQKGERSDRPWWRSSKKGQDFIVGIYILNST